MNITWRTRQGAYDGARARHPKQQAVILERSQRLAHRGAADLKSVAEFVISRKARTDRKFSRLDFRQQRGAEVAIERDEVVHLPEGTVCDSSSYYPWRGESIH